MVGFLRKNYWISLGLLAILIRFLFSIFPSLYAFLYRDTLFPVIRFIFDHTFGILPFAAAYLVLPITLLWVMYIVIRWIKLIFWKRQIKKAILSLFNFSMGLTFLFLFIWGFHYARPAIEDTIGLQVTEGLTINELKDEIAEIHDTCIQLRTQFQSAHHQVIPDSIYSDHMVDQIRTLEQQILQGLSIPVNGYVPARFIRPDGLLLRFNASGIYIPITGEAHIENALPMYVKVFTTAHELAHGFGYGSEADCNFIAYITCTSSEDPSIQYAGQFAYLRYLLAELKNIIPTEEYQSFRKNKLSIPFNTDLDHLYAIYDQYPGIADQFQRKAYDLYLKSQGIKVGIRSYNRMVNLCYAWRKLS